MSKGGRFSGLTARMLLLGALAAGLVGLLYPYLFLVSPNEQIRQDAQARMAVETVSTATMRFGVWFVVAAVVLVGLGCIPGGEGKGGGEP